MQIEVVDHVAGASRARGIALVIDVFRAFAVAPHAVAAGASRVLPVGAIDEALALRDAMPGVVLVGERHARSLPGSTPAIRRRKFSRSAWRGKPVMHTTHAGTQGLVNATGADEVLTASLNNLSALCRYVQIANPQYVTIVRMGHEARERCAEDDLYAESAGGHVQRRQGANRSRGPRPAAPCACCVKFFDPAADWAPNTDFEYCTAVDRFDFVLRLRTGADGRRELERIDVPEATA
ncbi:MAG: 2-phosphosulfolactate phosphatase [Proteobacteria bacterium]|nr:2-phosphosulfolactate phosphatase [Pseudomonadota bacterium]